MIRTVFALGLAVVLSSVRVDAQVSPAPIVGVAGVVDVRWRTIVRAAYLVPGQVSGSVPALRGYPDNGFGHLELATLHRGSRTLNVRITPLCGFASASAGSA